FDMHTTSTSSPVFTTCGFELPLFDLVQRDSIVIKHSIPETCKGMAKLRDDPSKCDITIIIGDKTLYAHKDLLISRINFFRILFNSNMIECAKGEINLFSNFCEFGFIAIENLLEYAYTGCIYISNLTAQDLMIGASFLQIESVMDECAEFMRRRIRIENALSLLMLCRTIAYHDIDKYVLNFIETNIVLISLTPEFIELPFDELVDILQRNSLHVDEENQVFEIISRWINRDSERLRHSERLLKCLRCTLLSENFISDVIEKSEWIMHNDECIILLKEAKEWIRNNGIRNGQQSFNSTVRLCEEAHRLIFSIKDYLSSDQEQEVSVELYDPITNTWTECDTRRKMPHRLQTVAINHQIYFFGGTTVHPDIVEFYDTVANEWRLIPNIPSKRTLMASGVIDGKIYVAGGTDEVNPLSTLETYDPSLQVWSLLTSLTRERSAAASSVHDGQLYVFGGYNTTQFLNDGECYDPTVDSWFPICPMKYKRAGAAAVILNGKIYIVGGHDGRKSLREVERYDTANDTWTTVSSMKTPRALATLTLSCGKLFVMGGYDSLVIGRIHKVTSMEMYNPEKDIWETMENMNNYYSKGGTLPIPTCFPSPVANLEGIYTSDLRFLLKPELLSSIVENKLVNLSEVHYECVQQAILGMDIVCHAAAALDRITVSVISTLQQLELVEGDVSLLILCDTVELAYKIRNEYHRFSQKYMPKIKVKVFCEDSHINYNMDAIKKNCPHIVIGTPGRIFELVQSDTLKLNVIKHLVLNEFDRLIGSHDTFYNVKKIVKFTPNEKQVMIFSATIPNEFNVVCNQFLRVGPRRFQFLSA
ncbi:hypothetical protein PENTCL1PPCAC_13046, partial [Pristionchus entomophagus]